MVERVSWFNKNKIRAILYDFIVAYSLSKWDEVSRNEFRSRSSFQR